MSLSQLLFNNRKLSCDNSKSFFPQACDQTYLPNDSTQAPFKRHLCGTSVRKKASYSIEASVALPVFMGFAVCVMFFIRIIMTGWAIDNAMTKAVDMVAVSDDAPSVYAAEALFYEELLRSGVSPDAIYGGKAGISLLESKADEKNVTLCAAYRVNLPIRMFSGKGIFLYQKKSARIWNGYDPKEDAGDELTVFVTPYGRAYHRIRGCPYINPSVSCVSASSVSLRRNCGGHRYKICPMCKGKAGDMVYITSWGDCYHGSASCSGLKRTIRAIKLSEAEAKYHSCPKCGGG